MCALLETFMDRRAEPLFGTRVGFLSLVAIVFWLLEIDHTPFERFSCVLGHRKNCKIWSGLHTVLIIIHNLCVCLTHETGHSLCKSYAYQPLLQRYWCWKRLRTDYSRVREIINTAFPAHWKIDQAISCWCVFSKNTNARHDVRAQWQWPSRCMLWFIV